MFVALASARWLVVPLLHRAEKDRNRKIREGAKKTLQMIRNPLKYWLRR